MLILISSDGNDWSILSYDGRDPAQYFLWHHRYFVLLLLTVWGVPIWDNSSDRVPSSLDWPQYNTPLHLRIGSSWCRSIKILSEPGYPSVKVQGLPGGSWLISNCVDIGSRVNHRILPLAVLLVTHNHLSASTCPLFSVKTRDKQIFICEFVSPTILRPWCHLSLR